MGIRDTQVRRFDRPEGLDLLDRDLRLVPPDALAGALRDRTVVLARHYRVTTLLTDPSSWMTVWCSSTGMPHTISALTPRFGLGSSVASGWRSRTDFRASRSRATAESRSGPSGKASNTLPVR